MDEVVAESLDVHEHQGVERPVQTERHEERVQHRNDDGEDERGMGVHPGQADAEAVADPHADRADDEGGQRADDDHAEERHEHQLDAFGNDLLQSVVDEGEHGGHEQWYEDVATVVVELNRYAERRHGAGFGAEYGGGRALNLPGESAGYGRPGHSGHHASKLRGHKRGHNRTAEPRVDVQFLGRIVSDHNRQNGEHTLPNRLE